MPRRPIGRSMQWSSQINFEVDFERLLLNGCGGSEDVDRDWIATSHEQSAGTGAVCSSNHMWPLLMRFGSGKLCTLR